MAKFEHGSKSQAIAEYLAKNPAAGVNQIVEDLKQQGIDVSLGLAKVVKYGKKGKKRSARRAARPAAANGKSVSSSELIRRFIARHPRAMPKEIGVGLREQGIVVSPGLISNVKYGSRGKKEHRRKGRAPAARSAARTTSLMSVTIEQLLDVKRLADSLGGVTQLRTALETLDQLQ